MATANERIRDALIKRQIALIKQSGAVSREIVNLLEDAHKDLRVRLDERIKKIIASGSDTGPTTTRRLLALEKSLRGILGKPHRKIGKRLRSILQEIALEDPRVVAIGIKGELPVVVSTTIPSAAVLKAIVDEVPIDGAALKIILGKLESDTVDAVMASVRRGMALGEGIGPIRQRIRRTLDLTRSRAETIVRTATNTISNRARQEFFKDNADVFRSLVWVATLDSRTCPFCGALDGRRFKVDQGPRPPAHPNCRCTMVGAINATLIGERPLKRSTEVDLLAEFSEKSGIKPVKRRASLPRGFKGKFDRFAQKRVRELTGRVPASETFSEFLRKQSPAFQNEVLREQVAGWYRKRLVDLDDLFDDNGNVFSIDEILRRRPDLREAT